jgi:WD40 repeat protein/serine/threonine protein kinase
MTDRLGQQLGNYRLTRLLGQGGFADVYLGEHTLLGTRAALKMLHTQVDQDEVAHFQQEARLLANLKHPHIIAVFDFGLAGQTPYLVMDYASQGTLRARHARGTRLSPPTVVDYVTQVAEALQYAHDHNVVHRDVKPENMLIGEQGELLLSDFGIALIAHSSRQQPTQDVIGTIAYMSPEQLRGKPQAASDQYALGIVVYEWLSGTPPFQGSFTELCTQHLLASPPPLPALSPAVEQVVLTALAKDPARRFETVAAFATALQQASQGTLPTEYPPPADRSSVSPALFPAASSATRIQPPPVRSDRPVGTSARRAILRRAVLIGAGGAVIVTGGSGLFALVHQPHQGQTVSPQMRTHQGQLFLTYRGHAGPVNAVAWSPDGQRIASGSADRSVQVWNARDGRHGFTCKGHAGSVKAVAWSPDGQRIASGSADRSAQVWNARDGRHGFTYKGHSDVVSSVAWSPQGKWIASGSYDNTVQVWNSNDGSHFFTYRGHLDGVLSVAWSPDGQRIASGSADGSVQVWNVSDGYLDNSYGIHSSGVSAVAWSPDGQHIASGSYDNTVQVWNASDGGHTFIYQRHSTAVLSVTWSPDGKWIASGSGDNTVQVWNARDGSHIFIYQGHPEGVLSAAWSPHGQHIASSSDDKTVQVWQAV